MKTYPKRACPVCRKLVSTAGFSWGPHIESCRQKQAAAKMIPPSLIESVKQSPLNGNRWSLALNCGHDVWITSKSRPTRKSIRCTTCIEKLRRSHSGDNCS